MADEADVAPVVTIEGAAPWGMSPGDLVLICTDVDRRGKRQRELMGRELAVEEVGFGYVKAGGVFWEPSGVRKTG